MNTNNQVKRLDGLAARLVDEHGGDPSEAASELVVLAEWAYDGLDLSDQQLEELRSGWEWLQIIREIPHFFPWREGEES